MNVLDWCSGIATGYHALRKAKIKIDRYDAIEKDFHARLVADINSKGFITRPCHDVYDFRCFTEKIDLVLAGTTCSTLTVQGSREGLRGESKILLECVNQLDYLLSVNQNIKFLFENVASMSSKNRKEIDDLFMERFGVKSIKISSALVSGQARDRLYWTNIDFPEFRDKKISAKSVLESDAAELRAWSKSTRYKDRETGKVYSSPAPGRDSYIEQRFRTDDKANTLVTGEGCRGPSTMNKVIKKNGGERPLTVRECARLQALPDSFDFSMVSESKAYKMIGMGWTLDVIAHILKGLKK